MSDTQLPPVVHDFVAAQIAQDADAAAALLTEDAVLVDQEETIRGREDIRAFLQEAGTRFEYTTEQTGAARVDDVHWVVTLRLEGTFPGGVAELDHRFALRGDRVADLVIANHGG